jgi:chromosome segregation ATPase
MDTTNTQLSFESSTPYPDQKFQKVIRIMKQTCLNTMKNDEVFQQFFAVKETAEYGIGHLVEKLNELQKHYNFEIVSSQQKELEELQSKVQNLNGEIEKLTQSNLELQNKLNMESLEHNQNMQERVNELEKRIGLILQEKEDIEIENCELEEKIGRLGEEFEERMGKEKERMREEKERLKGKIGDLEIGINELEKFKFKSQLEQENFYGKVEEKCGVIAELEKELERVKMEKQRVLEDGEEKEREMEEERGKFIQAQKELKKVEYERNELVSSRERKERAHAEEMELLKKKLQEMENNVVKKSKDKEYKEHIRILEQKFQEIRNNSRMSIHRLEEVEFENGQLRETIQNTKQELVVLGEKMSGIRKEKHRMELDLIESKDKMSELLMQNSGLVEDLAKSQQEVEYIKKQFNETDAMLKIERRKAACLERELDQCKFTVTTLEKNSQELVESLREQTVHLRKEISSLENRLERQLKDSQRKIDEERKISMDAVDKLRKLENSEEALRVTVENLAKKVEFFKEKSLQACGTPQRYKGSQVQLRDSSSTKTLIKNKKSSQIYKNSKLTNLALKFKHLKDNYKKEKYQIKQQLSIFKKTLKTALQMLILQVNDQNRITKFIQRELTQAKKDLKHYESVMTEAEISSIRISSKRYLQELMKSKPDRLKTESQQSRVPRLSYDAIKAEVHSNSFNAQNYPLKGQNENLQKIQKFAYMQDSSKKASPSLAGGVEACVRRRGAGEGQFEAEEENGGVEEQGNDDKREEVWF